jgi:nucleotide-binding universal stress UspA family protein
MTITEQSITTAPTTAGSAGSAPYLLVGYDGSVPAQAALETATQLLGGGGGHLEIVYVAHLSGIVEMSPGAVSGMQDSFDGVAAELEAEVRARLGNRAPSWHFQRRNGSITEQLIAVATELRRQHGQDATVIIVGASSHLAHHIAGSVAVALARRAGFPLLVVPASGCDLHPGTERAGVDTSA